MPSSIVTESKVLRDAEDSLSLNIPDVDVRPQEPRQYEGVPLVDDAVFVAPQGDPEAPADDATDIEMVPAVFEDGLVYRASFAGGNASWDKQFYSLWGWNLKPFTDVANAARLVERCGSDLHYCAAWKKWLVWDGRRWEVDRTGKVNERAKGVLLEMRKMIPYTPEGDDGKYAKHVRRSGNKSGFSAIIELAQTIPPIPITPEQLDADPWLLNCLNGTIDLRTGQIRNHQRADLLTKIVPVEYRPVAQCPIFDAFLGRILDNNTALIGYLQRVVGYCLTGSDREKAMFVLFGDGNNGKTTFLETIKTILADYAGQVPIQSLLKKNWGESIPNDIAQLHGKRFVTSSETESGQELAVAKIKHLTGLATLMARFLYGEFFEFATTFKLFLDTNHKPIIRGHDPAIWNRLKFIPFTVTIPDDEIDREMGAKLRAEAAGILAWAVKGCLEWQERGLDEPKDVRHATQTYRREMDTMGRFISECCEVGQDFREPTANLYNAYQAWCDQAEEQPESQKAFGMALGRIGGLEPHTNGRERSWTGIRLLAIPRDATQC